MTMCICQLEYGYDCGREHTERSVKLKGASAIAAVVVHKTAIQFARLVSHYHAITGVSHCSADQALLGNRDGQSHHADRDHQHVEPPRDRLPRGAARKSKDGDRRLASI